MGDLKNLTLDELLTTNDPVTDTQVWAEIRRRLEEWAVLKDLCGYNAARAALEE